ncbi:response regulator [Sedimentisphaera salicampi]|uniref:histidine kinase n=1 Tax=Sedimentisphaera salicampi TaxID=1941349 RepID=A0A1W6LL43_9BACT|nr:response regulator [Sedimentisphaera salicampi]ARN56464.1 Stalked cell differentiation-controlling protein [Sedimentisphaera salicampi]OXU15350.1 Stalked cell differentiation-controlling protein [Sedimentisphaera salicampi]
MTRIENAKIMVVDDMPNNLRLLDKMLTGSGYHVSCFPKGALAIKSAKRNPPELILLDINMPEMNGYEVCKRLKADSQLSHIPIIFISALNNTEDKIMAFKSGGVDYITKPFKFEEVEARIQTHLKIERLTEQLEKHNEDLEARLDQKSRELKEANERLMILDKAKSDFLTQISHELRTPLNSILGVMKMLMDNGSGSMSSDIVEMFEGSKEKLMSIINDATLLTQIKVSEDSFNREKAGLKPILENAVNLSGMTEKGRTLECGEIPQNIFIYADRTLIDKAFESLFKTALILSRENSAMHFSCEDTEQGNTKLLLMKLNVKGQNIPEAILPNFFSEFSHGQTISSEGDFGLAPALTHRIFKINNAKVEAGNTQDGVEFIITFSEKSVIRENE